MTKHLDDGRTHRTTRITWVAAATVVIMLLAAGGVFAWRTLRDSDDGAGRLAARFADAWSSGRLSRVPYAGGTTGEEVVAVYEDIVAGLDAESVAVHVEKVTRQEDGARARLGVTWTLAGRSTWSYETTASLARVEEEWVVRWRPSVVHPTLTRGSVLVTKRQSPERAPILGRHGEPIVTERPVVHVGVVPGRVPNPGKLAVSLRDVLDIRAENLEQRIRESLFLNSLFGEASAGKPDHGPFDHGLVVCG